MKKYAQTVCGSVDNVKELYVLELKHKRLEKNLTCGQLNSMLGFGPEWPTILEMEKDPRLFTFDFHQKLIMCSLDDPRFEESLFCLTGKYVSEKITAYLQDPKHLEEALADFHASVVVVHATIWPADIEGHFEKICRGEPVREFAHNMLSPQFYASVHIQSCIGKELFDADQISV